MYVLIVKYVGKTSSMKVAMIALNRLNCYYLLLLPGLRHEGDELMAPWAAVDKPQVHQIVLLDSKLLYLLKKADKTGKLHVQLSNYVKELFLSSRTKGKCKSYHAYIYIYILLLKYAYFNFGGTDICGVEWDGKSTLDHEAR